jgi:hypothetical protein
MRVQKFEISVIRALPSQSAALIVKRHVTDARQAYDSMSCDFSQSF